MSSLEPVKIYDPLTQRYRYFIYEGNSGRFVDDINDFALTPNAKTSSSTTAELVVEDNSSSGSTDTLSTITITDTSESLSLKSKRFDLVEEYGEIKATIVAERQAAGLDTGVDFFFDVLGENPRVKAILVEIDEIDLAIERAKTKTTTTTTTTTGSDGNEETKTEVISHTEDITTGEIKDVVTATSQNTGEALDPEFEDAVVVDGAPLEIESSAVDGVDNTGNTKQTTFYEDGTVKEFYDKDGRLYTAEEVNAMTTEEMIEAGIPIQPSKIFGIDDSTPSQNPGAQGQEGVDEPTPEPTVDEMLQNKASKDDWRVRLRLAPQSDYLYNAPDPGILAPLTETDGILFPYLPRFDTSHQARYSNYDLTHSNYRGYFYAGSHQERINVTSTFTAQDTKEANYLLASLHFLRSCTKMFYGQDMQRGTPPPLVFLSGLGDYQFNEHPCVVEMVNINLPNDVDYIKAGDAGTLSGDFMSPLSTSKSNTTPSFANLISSAARLFGSGLQTGGTPSPSIIGGNENVVKAASSGEITRVPTKLEIIFVLYPIQTRDQISNEYSLKDYASGSLLKKGFW